MRTLAVELIRIYLTGGEEAMKGSKIIEAIEKKADKGEAEYTETGGPSGSRCHLCKFFIDNGKTYSECLKVNGGIYRNSWCYIWRANKPRQEWKEAV